MPPGRRSNLFSRVDDPGRVRALGLSATPDREELDEEGEPIEYNEHLLGQKLGRVVFRFTLADARRHGWLPEYEIHHHGVQLLEQERRDYDIVSRRVDDAAEELRAPGRDPTRARQMVGRSDELGRLAQAYVSATSKRKDLLYRAAERHRVTKELVTSTLDRRPDARVFCSTSELRRLSSCSRRSRVAWEDGSQLSTPVWRARGVERRLKDSEAARFRYLFRSSR